MLSFILRKSTANLLRSSLFDGEFSKAKALTVRNVEQLHSQILKETNPSRIVQSFDQLSDSFCNLLDPLECIRNIHPDENIRENATNIFDEMAPLMYSMNSDSRLLGKINDSLNGDLSGNARMVSQTLKKDFEKSGAHLPKNVRDIVEGLNNELQLVCSTFIQAGYEPKERIVPINDSDIEGIESHLNGFITKDNGQTNLRITMHSGLIILSYCHSEELRRISHLIVTNASQEQLKLFEQMIELRYKLSTLQGFKSYTELTAGDRYLKTTSEIMDFIRIYDKAHFNVILPIFSEMKKLGTLTDWNTLYFMNKLHNENKVQMPIKNQSSPYTIDTVMKGAIYAVKYLFGVTLTRIQDDSDLLMHGKVQKYAVVHKRGLLGFIYFDLIKRPGAVKLAEAAHFTIRCPRRIDWDVLKQPRIWSADDTSIGTLSNLQGKYQLPVVMVVTDYESDDSQLTFHEASTIFHELGHAMHTMLGITDLQMLSGTRCLHDIAEIPSIFMEKMIVNPYVLNHVFGYSLEDARGAFGITNGIIPSFESPLEIIEDVWTSVVDQALHSDLISKVKTTDYYTCGIVAGLNEAAGEFGGNFGFKQLAKEALNTKYASFPHLTGYGSSYYSYLFARAIANKMHTQQNTFYGKPETWTNGLAEEFMTMGGYHSREYLNKIVLEK